MHIFVLCGTVFGLISADFRESRLAMTRPTFDCDFMVIVIILLNVDPKAVETLSISL